MKSYDDLFFIKMPRFLSICCSCGLMLLVYSASFSADSATNDCLAKPKIQNIKKQINYYFDNLYGEYAREELEYIEMLKERLGDVIVHDTKCFLALVKDFDIQKKSSIIDLLMEPYNYSLDQIKDSLCRAQYKKNDFVIFFLKKNKERINKIKKIINQDISSDYCANVGLKKEYEKYLYSLKLYMCYSFDVSELLIKRSVNCNECADICEIYREIVEGISVNCPGYFLRVFHDLSTENKIELVKILKYPRYTDPKGILDAIHKLEEDGAYREFFVIYNRIK